jgi:two-component system phosphate regulon sensor histidine kinase PhoR
MRNSLTAYTWIAILSFAVLGSVQYFLLYNTYVLKDKQYLVSDRIPIDWEYKLALRSDKLFPGGLSILDGALLPQMGRLKTLHTDSPAVFYAVRRQLMDSLFLVLKKANNMDSLLKVIICRRHLQKDLKYALYIRDISASFQRGDYIPLMDTPQLRTGILIGGTLEQISPQNLTTDLTINTYADNTYQITFDLYVDVPDRRMHIFGLMLPAFLLSLGSIAFVVILFFITLRSLAKQKQLSEMKSDFINGITHEFHTPLTAIIVANKTIQNENILLSRNTIKPLTDVIGRQSDRLKHLIAQVLDLTTFQKMTLHKETLNLHPLLEEIIQDYRIKIQGSQVQVSLYKGAIWDEVSLDPFWFTTLLLNIFDNAAKYNQSEIKEMEVSTSGDRKTLNVSIRDNGIGMSPETGRFVFEKFYRDASQMEVRGLGLGLYYVLQVVKAHGWKIQFDSRQGVGTTFVISIPLERSLQ